MSMQITQTFARIGVDTTPGRVNIQTQNPRLNLHHTDAKVEIRNDFPRVEISNRECFNTAGLKDVSTLRNETVQLAKSAVAQYTAKVAGDGDTFARIENKSNPIPSLAKRDAYPTHDFNVDSIPKARPQISVKGGNFSIDVIAAGGVNNGVEGNFIPGRVSYDVSAANVRTYMLQRPSVDIKFVGGNVDTYG